MEIQCPQCGTNQDAPTNFCKKCGVGFMVKPHTDQRFIAYLCVIILGILLLALKLGVIH